LKLDGRGSQKLSTDPGEWEAVKWLFGRAKVGRRDSFGGIHSCLSLQTGVRSYMEAANRAA
jgi:hypothetical protein